LLLLAHRRAPLKRPRLPVPFVKDPCAVSAYATESIEYCYRGPCFFVVALFNCKKV
jgi:hypothetical protein